MRNWKEIVKQDAKEPKYLKHVIAWSFLPKTCYNLLLVDMKETKSNQLVLVFYSLDRDAFHITYAPTYFAPTLRMLKKGAYWMDFKVDSRGIVRSIEYASSGLSDAILQEIKAEFLQQLAEAYREIHKQQQMTEQSLRLIEVYSAYSEEMLAFTDLSIP